ncbi:hypothetical protein KUCAC02_029648 [Chaenocephalus aceratus]|nr:hypothetical protein KUCAC02_029648 [Chaenocephalus aceratus]
MAETFARLRQKKKMTSGGLHSIQAVKRKIKVLQEQAEEADDRAAKLQKEGEREREQGGGVLPQQEAGSGRGGPGESSGETGDDSEET